MSEPRLSHVFSLIPQTLTPELRASYSVEKPVMTVGRHPSNDITVPLESVSRYHARIEIREGELFVVDLKSRNGTLVNQQKVVDQALNDRDQICFGHIAFVVNKVEPLSGTTRTPTGSQVRVVPSEDSEGMQTVVEELTKTDASSSAVFEDSDLTDAAALNRARKLLSTLYDFHKRLGDKIEEQEIFESLLDLIFDALSCDRGVILAREDAEAEFVPVHSKVRGSEANDDIAISQTIIDRCLNEGVAVLSRDAMQDERFKESESILLHDIRLAMCAPLVSQNQVLAICFVDTSEGRDSFTGPDLEFFSTLTNEVAILIDNARMRREMVINEQMAAIGETIMGMAHNVKNILLLTKGGIDLVDNCIEKKNYESLDRTWEVIKRGLGRINTMVKDMLEFSRQREVKKTIGDFNEIIRATVDLIRENLEAKSIRLALDLDDAIPGRMIDTEGFEKALFNLLVNACEAVEEGKGKVAVRTSVKPDGSITVIAQDNGEGIEFEKKQKIFLPFFTTKGSKGTGLGLPMVKKYIESMGGRIRCKSRIGVGTAFEITFPPEPTETLSDKE